MKNGRNGKKEEQWTNLNQHAPEKIKAAGKEANGKFPRVLSCRFSFHDELFRLSVFPKEEEAGTLSRCERTYYKGK